MTRLAICMSGYLTEWFEESIDSLLTALNINNNLQIDFFFHTWVSKESEKNICKKRIETKIKSIANNLFCEIQEQKQFNSRDEKEFRAKSKFCSKYSVVNRMFDHEKTIKEKYDFVILTRNDLAWFKKINFSDIEKDKLYVAGPKREFKVNDLFFIGNSLLIKKFVSLYEKLENDDSYWVKPIDGVSGHQHRIECLHLKEEKIYDNLGYYLDRPWGRSRWEGDVRLLRLKKV